MTFKDFILVQPIHDDIEGDFIKDSIVDIKCNRFPDTDIKENHLIFLRRRNACKEAMSAFDRLWNKYLKAKANVCIPVK